MRYLVLGMIVLFALGDGCAPSPGVGVQDLRAGRRPRPRRDDQSPDPRSNRFGRLALHGVRPTRAARSAYARSPAIRRSPRARRLFHGDRRCDGAKDETASVGYLRLVPLLPPRPSDARAAADALACPDADGRPRRAERPASSGAAPRSTAPPRAGAVRRPSAAPRAPAPQ